MTSNGVVTAGAMLFCQDMSCICKRERVCVCDAFGGDGNPFSGKSMCLVVGATWSSRIMLSEVCFVVETRFLCERYIAGLESAVNDSSFARRMSPDLGSDERQNSAVGI